MYPYRSIQIYTYLNICVRTYMYIYMYVCIYVYMYVYLDRIALLCRALCICVAHVSTELCVAHAPTETNSSSCHNVLILLSLSGVTNLSFLVGVCAACMLAYRCLQMKLWAAVTVVAIPSQKAMLMCPYVSCGNFSVLAPRCFRALLHNLQLTSDRCLIFASYLATRLIPAIAIISRLLCLQGTRRSFKYFPKNALLFFCRNMKSAVHVPYAG